MRPAHDALVREAINLLLARQPTGKSITVTLSCGHRFRPVHALVRLDVPGVLKAFDAATGEPLFEAQPEDIARALGGDHHGAP